MSSLFRNVIMQRCGLRHFVSVALVAALPHGAADAADFYFTPEAELQVESHTNIGLAVEDNGFKQDVEGYRALVGGIAGYRTPRSVTEVRPRLRFQDFPDRDDLKKTNGSLDLSSNFKSLRGSADFVANYRREDLYRSEIAQAEFDDFEPGEPVADDTGRVDTVSETRTTIAVRPSGEYRLTERLGIGVESVYQTVDFDGEGEDAQLNDDEDRVDYDYWLINPSLLWDVGQRTRLGTGVYTSKYEAKDDSNKTDSVGASLDLNHDWSQTFRLTSALLVERTKVDEVGAEEDKLTSWSLEVGVLRSTQTGRLRTSFGRYFTPSSDGSRAERDELRVQYARNLTQRWTLIGAVRAFRNRSQGGEDSSNDRDFARGDLSVKWLATPTVWVGGGYTYIWQDRKRDSDHADDNMFMLRIGYQGLAPQR